MVKHYTKWQGFSTVELLIAMAILVIVFGAVSALILGSQKISSDTETAHEAQLLAQKYLEQGRSEALANFASDQTIANINYPSDADPFYKIKRTENPIPPCVKELAVTVMWKMEKRDQTVTLQTQITSPEEAFAVGGDCSTSGPPSGGGFGPWEYCADFGTADINPSGNEGTDIDAFNIDSVKYIALTSSKNPDPNHDLWIYNVSTATPIFVSSLNLGKGAQAVTAAKNEATNTWYLYVANEDNTNQLRVISLANLASPVQVSQLSFAAAGTGKDVYYYQGFVYVAVGNTIQKVNVSDPASPSAAGSFSLASGQTVNKLVVSGNHVYAATTEDSRELVILNIAGMTVAGSYNTTGADPAKNGTSLFLAGSRVYLGLERSASAADFYILNVANPTSVTVVGTPKNLGHNPNSILVDIAVSGPLAFIASDSSNDEFQVWNISDPSNIVQQCVNDTVHISQAAVGLDFLDNVAYGSIRSQDAVHTMYDPKHPPQ